MTLFNGFRTGRQLGVRQEQRWSSVRDVLSVGCISLWCSSLLLKVS